MTNATSRGCKCFLVIQPIRRAFIAVLIAVAFSASHLLFRPAPAAASITQLAIIEDDAHLLRDPLTTLRRFRQLGADMARVFVTWAAIAPHPAARRRPAGFDASDPAAYPNGSWDRWDEIDRDAQLEGISLEFTVTGGAPRWAEGRGIPRGVVGNVSRAWKPSAREFGAFVNAVATRYSGSYPDPQNAGKPLPRVSFWSIWNEPNFGEDLAPQAIDGSTVLSAPRMYRNLVDAAWGALQATGHGNDTILIGEMAAGGATGPVTPSHPEGLPGNFAMTKPIVFLRSVFCLDPAYRQLRATTAKTLGCPVNRVASSQFPAQNPALFNASGVSDHPYPGDRSPNRAKSRDPSFASFGDLPRLERDFDRIQTSYHSHRRFPIYNDEFGYITHPPNQGKFVSPRTAAYYINWAEYLSWRSPRIASTMQYLLYDPVAHVYSGEFATGLLASSGDQKPAYVSYRLPLYLPVTVARPRHSLEVWGCVRPAHYAALDTGIAQTAAIQFEPRSRGPFETLKTVEITNPQGYFDTRLRVPGSGTVRLAWTYPATDPFLSADVQGSRTFSRYVHVSVR